jgi:putative DNA primase/helicase
MTADRVREALDNTPSFDPWAMPNGLDGEPWPEREPLSDPADAPAEFPLDALPPVVRDAVAEYQRYGRQPIPLVAASALSAMSLTVQGLVNVRRDAALVGPCSLNIMVVAESGERKTAADGMFTAAVNQWKAVTLKRLEPLRESITDELEAYEAERQGILGALRTESSKPGTGQKGIDKEANKEQLRNDLKRLAKRKPRVPPDPAPFLEEATPEGIYRQLRDAWPSISWWSNEGGAVIGGHGFADHAIMRTLALINRLWDGQPLDRVRAGEKRSLLAGRRCTVSLMLQPFVLTRILTMHDGMARGLGTMARFLPTWPVSTMGTRNYLEPADIDLQRAFPALAAFGARIGELLALPLPMAFNMETLSFPEDDPEGGRGVDYLELHPVEIGFSRPAHKRWVKYHDAIEAELAAVGDYATVKDVAAKSAENAARIACVLHTFACGPTGEIDEQEIEQGARIAHWFLGEARRILASAGQAGEGETAAECGDAKVLADWLQNRSTAPTLKEISQYAPYRVRKKSARDRTIAFLQAKGWARVEEHGGTSRVVLHPELRGLSQ